MYLSLRKSIKVLGPLLSLFAISCSGAELSSSPEIEAAQLAIEPAEQPPVEYGASIEEWDEAVQNETNTSSTVENIPASIEPTALPTAVADVPTAAATAVPVATVPISITTGLQLTADGGIFYQEIYWDTLVPYEFSPEVLMAKYETQLAQIADGSPEANELYIQIQEEFNSAPINSALDGAYIKLPGFIAPLEYTDDKITEFLLVPYFGACIHVPAPPPSQTVLVKTLEGHGIDPLDAYKPIWVLGMITTDASTTELADAGYFVEDAVIELYNSP